MSELMIIFAVIAGAILGGAAVFFARRGHESALRQQASRIPDLEAESVELRQQIEELRVTAARLETQRDTEAAANAEKLEELKEARKALATEFENLANRIFDDKAGKFKKQNEEQLGNLLNPLKTQITDFKQKVEEVYVNEAKERTSLLEQVKSLKELNEHMTAEAQHLTQALKGDSKMRGNWGEATLKRVLESSGLTEGREFDTEVQLKTRDGKAYRPDVVVHLPDGKDVIIDAKLSLVDYVRATDPDEDDAGRADALKAHISSMRAHVKTLADKRYDELEGLKSLDMVLMFVPVEPAMILAAQNAPDLFADALAKKIAIVSPTTLHTVLRVVENLWRLDDQGRNAEKIAERAAELYKKLNLFVESLSDVGDKLDRARDSYDEAMKRLSTGRGNVIRQAEMLRELGVKTDKQLPAELVEQASDDDDPQLALGDS